MSTLRIQLKLPNNITKVLTLPTATTLHTLQQSIQEHTNIEPTQQQLIDNYTHKSIDLTDNNKLLTQLDIKSGDSITVKQIETTSSTNITSHSDNDVVTDIVPLRRIVINDDNSCLFNAISYCISQTTHQPQKLRSIVANEITTHNSKYDTAFLDNKTHNDYAQYIQQPTQWGGSVELLVLAQRYNICIVAIDIEHIQPYKYNEQSKQCIYIVYSGIHYDSLVDDLGMNDSTIEIRIFDTNDTLTLQRALATARQLNVKKEYTNVYKFTIRCSTCKNGFVGAKEAQQHATETKHTSFEEYA